MEPFIHTGLPSRVLFGAGRRSELGAEVARLGGKRALVITTPGQKDAGTALVATLGAAYAGLCPLAVMHTPVAVTEKALAQLRELGSDCLVAYGGGSAIGLAKALALRTDLPQIALPTTYAGSEMTPMLGQTEDGRKTTQRSMAILPETVIYDVELTMGLPADVSGTSGINAIAHAVEALYAQDRNPVTDVLAVQAIAALGKALPAIHADTADVAARTDALYGAFLAGSCLASVGMALHHKLCHVLGGSFDLPHAQTHTVMLPHTLAYNAPAVPRAVARIAEALGSKDAPAGLFDLAARVGAVRSLRELGMAEDGIDRAADIAMQNPYWNPRPLERNAIRDLIARGLGGGAAGGLELAGGGRPHEHALGGVDMIETDVLVVGSGPAGSTAAALLSSYGVDNMLVTKYRWLSDTPRAHITNQRALEVLRDLDVEKDAILYGTPSELMGDNVFCTSIAGEELGRLRTWGTHPMSAARRELASPTKMMDLPQNFLEPIVFGAACARGTKARLSTEYLGHSQDESGVTTRVRDRISGEEYEIRSKYLIGADGGNSKVAEDAGLRMHGKMGVAGSINILFKGDLSRYVAHRPSVLYWVMQPGSNVGGIGMGLVRMIRPWDEWLIVWGYDINHPAPKVDEAFAKSVAYSLIGDDTIPIEIKSVSTWTVNHMHALDTFKGRVFCMGDAIHRHPPSNGLGSNTSIQDAFNLAWKLSLVVKGHAAPSLLATYQDERAPIAKQVVDRANKSIEEFGPIFQALGLLDTKDPAVMVSNMAARKENSETAEAQRGMLREAIASKVYEFDAHGVEMNQRYVSSAVVGDGSAAPGFSGDPELVHHATTYPGAHLPHVWVERNGVRLSTLDLCGKGRFTLLTGIGGEGWMEAAKYRQAETGMPIATAQIGPGCEYEDIYGDWARASEVGESGCVLVRPDHFVAWRAAVVAADPRAELAGVLSGILGKPLAGA